MTMHLGECRELVPLQIGDVVQVYGVAPWIVTRLADMDGRLEVSTLDGHRECLLRKELRFVERSNYVAMY